MDKLPSEVLIVSPSTHDLSPFDLQFVNEWLSNGNKGTDAYVSVRPDADRAYAAVQACKILQKIPVREYVAAIKGEMVKKVLLTKDTLIEYTQYGLEVAKSQDEIATLFKGVEVGAKLIGAYEQDQDDLSKYTGLLGRIKADNVQININNNG